MPGRIVLVSTRKIFMGEELHYDYDTNNIAEEQLGIPMQKLVKCLCGSSKCVGWVF